MLRPPPLAGALAAWLSRQGWKVRIVDPRGAKADWTGSGPLWVHLDADFEEQRLAPLDESEDLLFFGPALRNRNCQRDLIKRFSRAKLVEGDPESEGAILQDLSSLPITTYDGFGSQPGGLFRILAGRGCRPRPIEMLCREIIYLVETFSAGHLLFDDEDLGYYPGWLDVFSSELRALPWPVSWEGTFNGKRMQGKGRQVAL